MDIDLAVELGNENKITLPNPIVGASGSFGFGIELKDIIDLGKVGAVTIKSLAPFVSPGNPAPRLATSGNSMMNSVGQPGPDIREWVKTQAGELKDMNCRYIMSIWGKTIDDYTIAAESISGVIDLFEAVEINLSCPNVHGDGLFFAQIPNETKEIVKNVRQALGDRVFITSKLTAAVRSVPEIASAAIEGGTDCLTLFNTLLGLDVDPFTRSPSLGKGGGGYSGKGISPIVQRGIYDTHKAYPEIPIIGTGGVSTGENAATLMMCGASAVGVATATFADPRATLRIIEELKEFCFQTGVANVSDLIGSAEMPEG